MNIWSPSSPASTKSHALLIASFFLGDDNAQAGIHTNTVQHVTAHIKKGARVTLGIFEISCSVEASNLMRFAGRSVGASPASSAVDAVLHEQRDGG